MVPTPVESQAPVPPFRTLLDVPLAPTDLKLPFYSAWPQAQRMMTKRDF